MKNTAIRILIEDNINLNPQSEFSFIVKNIADNRKAHIFVNPPNKIHYDTDNYFDICWSFNGSGSFFNKKSIRNSVNYSKYIVVALWPVKEESCDIFYSKTISNAELSVINEKGCLSFGVFKSFEKDSVFALIEFFQTEKDFLTHMQTQHFLDFKKSIGDIYIGSRKQTIKGRLG